MAIENAKILKKQLQESYFEEQLQNIHGDSEKLWRVMKEFWPSKPKSNVINRIGTENNTANIGDKRNEHFLTIGTILSAKIDKENFYSPIFDLKEVDFVTVAEAIRELMVLQPNS